MSTETVFITGASRGIGKALALLYASLGFTVIGFARDVKILTTLFEEIKRQYNICCLALKGDLKDPQSIEKAFEQAFEFAGDIDILINNAGIGIFDHFVGLSQSQWQAMIDVNLKGPVFCTRQVLPAMIRRKKGTIVNVSSICGLRGYAECSAYCATKFATVGFSESLAKEVAPFNISVYAVCPDIVDTDFADGRNAELTKSEKMLTAEEVSSSICKLTSRRLRSQICSIHLHPVTRVLLRTGLKYRAVLLKRIRWL